jgi:hypothetical protein
LGQEAFFYSFLQALVFAIPVGGILIFFGRKLQKVESLEKELEGHIKSGIEFEKCRREELQKIYNRINSVAEAVNYIKGKLSGGKI